MGLYTTEHKIFAATSNIVMGQLASTHRLTIVKNIMGINKSVWTTTMYNSAIRLATTVSQLLALLTQVAGVRTTTFITSKPGCTQEWVHFVSWGGLGHCQNIASQIYISHHGMFRIMPPTNWCVSTYRSWPLNIQPLPLPGNLISLHTAHHLVCKEDTHSTSWYKLTY